MQKIVHNVETNQISIIELTESEIEELEAEKVKRAKLQAEKQIIAANEIAKKRELLEKLGITEEEAKLLLS